ncbi:hypothetical protein ACYOEI_19530 [Singulisphaera rosea]
MRNRTILLVLGLVVAMNMTLNAGDLDASRKIMTPDVAIEDRTGGTITIEFRVGRVGMLTGLQPEGMPPHLQPIDLVAEAPLKCGGEFHAYINGKFLEDLHRLAVVPTKQFEGALVQVTGTLRKVEVEVHNVKRDDYQVVILDLDKFRVLQRPAN